MATNDMIYLDNAATTRPDDEVVEAMLPFLRESYANPSAAYGAAARIRRAVGIAREQIAQLINADPDEIYFTSGGTESDNLAIAGITAVNSQNGSNNKVITSNIEHPAVSGSFAILAGKGYRVEELATGRDGILAVSNLERSLTAGTGFVSVMTANNEIGSVNDVAAMGAICRERGILFHTDAVQAVGHIPIDVKSMNIDALSASGHKFHGPKGVGFLYIRRGINVSPIIHGGGQEKGMRSGTENVASIVGMGMAAAIAERTMKEDAVRIADLRDGFAKRVLSEIPGSILNGPTDTARRLPGNAHFAFSGVEGASLLIRLDMKNICASTGSACSASKAGPSKVLKAIGLPEEYINGSVRFSLSKYTSKEELDRTAEVLRESIAALRTLRAV